ncbi:MAG: oxidoreductase-like domain-containing protein [Neisseria sp.]|nr:oxidoreductase-like domain-containing protein [Neisseria sp.]
MTQKPDLAEIAARLGETLLPEPTAPEDWECCGSECGDACIHTIYQTEKQAYQAQQKRLKAAADGMENAS